MARSSARRQSTRVKPNAWPGGISARKYFIQPRVNNEWLKTGLGRNIPCMPSVVKDDPWWLKDDPHRLAYVQQGVLGPTLPQFWAYNPAYAQLQSEHTWSTGWMDIIQG